MLSLIIDPSLAYPDAEEFYSPDERFPEYRYGRISLKKNPVYSAVRNCLHQSGLDRQHFGTSSWNPLGEFIAPGSQVFVLCNLVFHRVPGESAEDFSAKCTHGSVLRALVDYALLAVGKSGAVYFGNAPMQGCNWESVLRETGVQAVQEFYRSERAAAHLKDLRLRVVEKNRIGAVTRVERRDEREGIPVDLGADSLLVELDRRPSTHYRVMNYSPARTEAFHSSGSHIYVISRHILEAHTIIGLPKLKTHEKVGITCALKGSVGAVSHKDSLPHHRFGAPAIGGDEYPADKTGIVRMASKFHDRVQLLEPDRSGASLLRVTDQLVRRVLQPLQPLTEGAWCGNDTAWRMVLDLARILLYAAPEGAMRSVRQRKHLALVDGIVGGEGEGPLQPKAVHSGLLLFGDSQLAVDWTAALMMQFQPHRLPVLCNALNLPTYPLLERPLIKEQVTCNGRPASLADLPGYATHHYMPPEGWRSRI